ncbi:MAG: chitobiase/beta-hexosaminidase C-terminal domain-containing protein, partial [Akkermansiaceae bacterium]|nr:chitobiase/beta-hexosaminidase C-terminal domain-containing protein [Verrucomicrobiales bacterium]
MIKFGKKFTRMICPAGLSLVIGSFVFAFAASAQTPATLTSLGTTAPTPGPNDVPQLSIAGQVDKPNGLNYYTDNQSNHGNGEPGQTFTTPVAASGYVLNSVAIKTGGGTSSGTTTAQSYLLHIYSVNGSNVTVLTTYIATGFSFTNGHWLRWTGLNVPFSPGSVYAYSFGKAANTPAGWQSMGNAGGNIYSGGELGLFPVAGGPITFSSSRSFDGVFNIGLTSTGVPTVASITNNPATTIQASAATLNGAVLSTGGSTPQITIFYGTNNGGTNAIAWSNSVAVGPQTGAFAASVSGLKTNTTYFFTAYATNNVGPSWAQPARSFATLTASPPTVTNLPATFIGAALATLNGQVLNTGNEWPTVRVYYGTNDGGTNPAAWTNRISIGAQSGVFNAQVAGLASNTTYFFTTSVSNSAGFAWGGPSKSFTTLSVTRIPVLTFHYDNTRQGANTNETLLTPANVNVASFGKLFTYAVDGYVYAQPLIMTNVNVPGKGVRNVVFAATMHNSVYAFDADSNGDANGGLLWQRNLGTAAVSPSPEYGARYNSQGNTDITPEEGATGTPVIDPVSGTIYLDAFTREVVAGVSTNYVHRIHALDIATGAQRPFSPVVVAASVPGTGVGGNGTTVTFSAKQHMQRPALTLAGGILYVCYGSHADTNPYHGWILGYNPTNLMLLTNYVFNTTPNATVAAFGSNAGEGALWMGGGGLVVDANTNLYFETGNGSFSAHTNGGDYGSSFVKLSTATNQLKVTSYFTPFNQAALQSSDADLGSGGPILLPDSVGSVANPRLLVGAGKEGKIYLLNRDNMGGFQAGSDSQIVQVISGGVGGGGSYGVPAYFNNRIFYTGKTDKVRAYTITNGVIVATPQSQSAASIGPFTGSPVVSANGTNNAIVWATDPGAYASSGPAVLHAYNATNLAIELYHSSQNLARDNPGGAVKMTAPVVAGGKVYVGAQYALSVFGPAVFLPAPTVSPAGGAFTNSVIVSLANATAGVSIHYTLDGTTPNSSSLLYTNPFVISSTTVVKAIAMASGAVNSAVTSVSFVNTAAAGNGIGLLGAYHTNRTSASPFTGSPVLVQTNATVNFDWGTNGPAPTVGRTNFTVRWTGSVQPQFNETYFFHTAADDGVRLYVNGQLLIDDWVDKTVATTKSNSIVLAAQQFYSLQLDYYQKTSNASVSLSWSSPSTPKSVIPQTQLYPFTNPPPGVVLVSPATNSNYTASASVTVAAEADALYNPISQVSFYANGNLLGSVTNIPYAFTTTGLGAGSYALTAVAWDGSGLSSTSAAVNITVTAGTGQPYGLTSNGVVRPFFNMPPTFEGALPLLLSQVGIFSNTASMTPTNGLIPFTPNSPLWSDNALKTRFVAVPNNGGLITPDEQIGFAPGGSWTFPSGSVFVKTFELNTDETNPNIRRRLETRLLVRDINGQVYGVTYKWRADNTDADLLTGSLLENIAITNATGVSTQTWFYPSSADCLTCHTPVANYVLGLNTRQLNGNQTYPTTGVTDNQLRTYNRLGLFNPAINESAITNYAKLSALTNLTASLQERARSYLDSNCSQCHQ